VSKVDFRQSECQKRIALAPTGCNPFACKPTDFQWSRSSTLSPVEGSIRRRIERRNRGDTISGVTLLQRLVEKSPAGAADTLAMNLLGFIPHSGRAEIWLTCSPRHKLPLAF
jgi:hypothetical protein